MRPPTEVERADVWRESSRVGTLARTSHGSFFEYDEVNLPPFFAGLLPEGLRLRALVQRVKTSEDDLFSLLLAAGADTVGDLSVVAQGGPRRPLTGASGSRLGLGLRTRSARGSTACAARAAAGTPGRASP